MKIAICDPSLTDNKGHHLEYQNALTNAIFSYNKDAEIIWYINKNHTLDGIEKSPKVKILGLFNQEFYKPEAFDVNQWSRDLHNVIEDCANKKVTKIIYHTSIGDDLKCLLLFIHEYKNIEFHLCTPYSPQYMPGSTRGLELIDVLKKLQIFPNFKLWLETIELSDYYLSLGIQCGFLGIPTWNECVVKEHSYAMQSKYKKKLILSYIGPARSEKKFYDFSRAIYYLSRSKEKHQLSRIDKIFVSIVPPKRGLSDDTKDGIQLLSRINNLNIQFCNQSLSREDYIQQVSKSHLVWLAYDQQAYADGRGSGILVDCLAAGTCFIARTGTTPQYYLRGNGFIIDDCSHCASKVIDFIEKIDFSCRASLKMQEHFLCSYSTSLLVQKLGIKSALTNQFTELSHCKASSGLTNQLVEPELSQSTGTEINLLPETNLVVSIPFTLCIVTTTFNGEATILKTIASILQQDCSLKIRYHVQVSDKTNDSSIKQVSQFSDLISKLYNNVVFSWNVSSDNGLYDGLLKAFNHVLPDCHDDTWMAWINDDDQLLPDTARILFEIYSKFPEVSFLTSIPSVRGSVNSINRRFSLSTELVKLGLYDGKFLPFIQQEGTFFKSKIFKKHFIEITATWPKFELAADYYLWKLFASMGTRFYLYDQPLAIFHISPMNNQLSSNQDKYLSEINSVTSEDIRISMYNQFVGEARSFEQYLIHARNWNLVPEQIIKNTFTIPLPK